MESSRNSLIESETPHTCTNFFQNSFRSVAKKLGEEEEEEEELKKKRRRRKNYRERKRGC